MRRSLPIGRTLSACCASGFLLGSMSLVPMISPLSRGTTVTECSSAMRNPFRRAGQTVSTSLLTPYHGAERAGAKPAVSDGSDKIVG